MFVSFLGANFCESILLPSEYSLKTSLEATLVNAKQIHSDNDLIKLDLCCRICHKCDAHKHKELNVTTKSHSRHCDCANSFQLCLNRLNTSLSKEFAFLYSVNATTCYRLDDDQRLKLFDSPFVTTSTKSGIFFQKMCSVLICDTKFCIIRNLYVCLLI